jgi:hypothetical protein
MSGVCCIATAAVCRSCRSQCCGDHEGSSRIYMGSWLAAGGGAQAEAQHKVLLPVEIPPERPRRAGALAAAVSYLLCRTHTVCRQSGSPRSALRPMPLEQRPAHRSQFHPLRYRPLFGQVYSPIGRTRTIPRADDDIGRMRIAYFSCSDLTQGYFTAYGWATVCAAVPLTLHSSAMACSLHVEQAQLQRIWK